MYLYIPTPRPDTETRRISYNGRHLTAFLRRREDRFLSSLAGSIVPCPCLPPPPLLLLATTPPASMPQARPQGRDAFQAGRCRRLEPGRRAMTSRSLSRQQGIVVCFCLELETVCMCLNRLQAGIGWIGHVSVTGARDTCWAGVNPAPCSSHRSGRFRV